MSAKKLGPFIVKFGGFANHTDKHLYIEHCHNGHIKPYTTTVPAKLYVKEKKHRTLLLAMARKTIIEIKYRYDFQTTKDTLVAIKVVKEPELKN